MIEIEEITFKSTSRIYICRFPDANKHKTSIIKSINNSLTGVVPNNQNFRTMWKWGLNCKESQELLTWIQNTFQSIFHDSSVGYNPKSLYISDCWANKYDTNSYAVPHNHFPYLYSFIYYVNIPNSNESTFFDGLGNIPAEEGKCIFFPSSVIHSVSTTTVNNRITIAGNICYAGSLDHKIGGGNFERWNNNNE